MTRISLTSLAAYALLGGAAGLTFLLPRDLAPPTMMASPAPAPGQIVLKGLVRDFLASHADFDTVPAEGLGHYAGNVSQLLGPDGRPLQVHGVSDFTISFGSVVPGVPYSARATVLGAEITSGGNPVPVTVQAQTDVQTFEPYGSYNDPVSGNVNDAANPRHHIFSLSEVYTAETPISITATSWLETTGSAKFGYDVAYGDQNDAIDHQVATQVTVAQSGTVTAISAYVRDNDDVRYALYADAGGEPGALLAESAAVASPDPWGWHTIPIPPTWVPAGTYWLALAQDDGGQDYRYDPVGGQTRRNGHDAEDTGFQASWSGTTDSWTGRVSIYATFTPDEATYTPHMTVRSGDDSPYVMVLEDGDSVPPVPAFQEQSALVDFLDPYVDVDTGLVKLNDNQAIYLFELGTTDLASPSADFQDLVVLITLATDPAFFFSAGTEADGLSPIGFKVESQWTDSAGRNVAPHLYRPSLGDSAGASGVTASGGVQSPASFYEWYRDIIGVNQSVGYDITMTDDGFGVYEFSTDAFYPLDGRLYGNEGDAHNNNFTYSVQASFTYDEDAGQFFELQGGDGAFLFIDGRLAIDLGGVQSGVSQRADVNRLGLTDGETYDVRLFYANRNPASSTLDFRTNVVLSSGDLMGSVTAAFD